MTEESAKIGPEVVSFGNCYLDINSPAQFPDGGIPVNTELIAADYETVPGGSAVNFCRLLGELGISSAFIGVVGEDILGDALEKSLLIGGVTPLLIRQPGVTTNISFNLTNPTGQHNMFVAGTANGALSPESVIPHLQELFNDASMLYIGSALKLGRFASSFGELARVANNRRVDLVIDHGRIPDDVSDNMIESVQALVKQARYYFPSRDEFCQLWHLKSIEDGLEMFHRDVPGLTVVVKDSKNGAYYWGESGPRHVAAVPVKEVINSTGAGDSFNAGVMTAILLRLELEIAVRYGCKVAAAKITNQPVPSPRN
jgi:ribokinase